MHWISAEIFEPNQGGRIAQAIDAHFDAAPDQTWSLEDHVGVQADIGNFSAILTALDVVSYLVLAVVMSIIGNTLAMNVRERTHEYGVMRAIGFGSRQLGLLVLAEAALLGLLGAAIGLGLSYPLFEGVVSRALQDAMDFPPIVIHQPRRLARRRAGRGPFGACGGGAHLPRGSAAGHRRIAPAGVTQARPSERRDDRVLALLKYNLLSLWVRRTTTLATTGGIALVVFVLGASQMLSTGIRQTISSAGSADQAIVLEHDAWTEAGSRMDHAAAGLVAAAPGVKRNGAGQVMVTEESVAHLMLQSLVDATRISTLQVRGVSANVFELRPEARIIAGRAIQPGTDEALVGKAVLGRYPGLRIGERVEFSSSTKPDRGRCVRGGGLRRTSRRSGRTSRPCAVRFRFSPTSPRSRRSSTQRAPWMGLARRWWPTSKRG